MSGLLRICTAGSVDDGKSTLIGRLLYDSQSVYEDQVHSVEKASKNRNAGPIDFSLFTDGLKAEREQGITIDVAYRYFAKDREVIVRGNSLIMKEQPFVPLLPGETTQVIKCRMRSLGCSPCTGAIRSDADTVPKIIEELIATKQSERMLRIIDHDQDGSMELKKREGYF